MIPLYWRLSLRLRSIILLLVLFVAAQLCLLTFDNTFRLGYHYGYSYFAKPRRPELQLMSGRRRFKVDLAKDVGLILKTGFGTKERPLGQLQAIAGGANFNDIVVTGDYSSEQGGYFKYHEKQLPVYDAVAWTMDALSRNLTKEAAEALIQSSDRLQKYIKLTTAIKKRDDDLALKLSKEFGWELDALKFVPGLELVRRLIPSKNWYVFVDDDTYLVQPTLELLLDQLDPQEVHFLGNGVGAVDDHFAHGGSGVIISQGALRTLFAEGGAQLIPEYYYMSLTEGLGDLTLARVLRKAGISLNEEYSRMFNGESPLITKIRSDRFCVPLTSFHGLKVAKDFSDIHGRLRDVTQPITWVDLWQLYQAPSFDSYAAPRLDWDHVGRLDEYTQTDKPVPSWEACSRICRERAESCLAWTWVEAEVTCHMSPWIILGDRREGSFSALNVPAVQTLGSECGRPRQIQ